MSYSYWEMPLIPFVIVTLAVVVFGMAGAVALVEWLRDRR